MQGLAIGIEVSSERYASRIEERCRKRGLLLTTEGATVLLLPALDITRAAARKGLDILERSV